MKTHRIELWALVFVFALFPAVTQAQSGTFRLYAGLAPTTYKISFDANAPDVGTPAIATYKNKTAKSSYTAANVGMTWASPKGIYVDLAASQSLSATHDLWNSTTTQKEDFSHDSYTLTGGYSHGFASGVSVSGFGGYTVSNTQLNAPKPPFGFSKDKFDSQGLFVGVGVGYPALGGQVSGSVAIAGMSGKWKDDSGFNNSATTTVGFSLGGGYTYPITQSLGVTADLRYQQYKYDFGAANTPTAYTVTEKVASLGVKLGYRF
jgi:Outer membrane protein beta-barrel domain